MSTTAEEPRFVIQHSTLRKQVEDKLREAIINGHFKPGAHLPDRSLCEAFGVSRALVREAVRRLEAEGLIETHLNRGSFVRTLSSIEASQIYDVRGALEALAARSFTNNATDAEVDELKSVLDDIKAFAAGTHDESILNLKHRFYEVLLRGGRNDYVSRMLNQILNRNRLLRATTLSNPDRLPKTIKELDKLMAAIVARDADAAWLASMEHVKNAAAVAIATLHALEEKRTLQTD